MVGLGGAQKLNWEEKKTKEPNENTTSSIEKLVRKKTRSLWFFRVLLFFLSSVFWLEGGDHNEIRIKKWRNKI